MKFRKLIPASAFVAALAIAGLSVAAFAAPPPGGGPPTPIDVNVTNPVLPVEVSNADSINVRDVDNPALQPFRAHINVNLGSTDTVKMVNGPTVPAGKSLVIENVSVWIFTSAATDIATGVWLTVPGISPPTFFLGDPTSNERKLIAGGGSIAAYNRLVRLYYNAGEVIQAQVFFDGTAGSKIVNYYLNGYLVNVP